MSEATLPCVVLFSVGCPTGKSEKSGQRSQAIRDLVTGCPVARLGQFVVVIARSFWGDAGAVDAAAAG